MKIINLPFHQLAIFKVGSELHVTVANLNDDKKIDVTKMHSDEFNDGIRQCFEGHFGKPITSYTSKTAPSLFDSTTQVLIIIIK